MNCLPAMEQRPKALPMRRRRRRKEPVFRDLEFYVISAQELRNVRHFGRMKTYVSAFVHPEQKVCTHTDEFGGTNPSWNERLCLRVEEDTFKDDSNAQLTFDIFTHALLRDKLVGSVTIILPDAVKPSRNLFPITSHIVFTLDGDNQGLLNICVPPGGRFPRRLDSLSFKEVSSVNGKQIEAVPSFKEGTEEEETEPESAQRAGAAAAAEQANALEEEDEDLGIYDESFFDDDGDGLSRRNKR